MNKTIVCLLFLAFLCSSCVEHTILPRPADTISESVRNNVEILGHTEAKTGGGRLWILFIPFGWGKEEVMETIAYKKALKKIPNADGLIDQKVTYTRVRVPLVVVTFVGKSIKVEGTAYRIKSDREKQNQSPNDKIIININNNTQKQEE